MACSTFAAVTQYQQYELIRAFYVVAKHVLYVKMHFNLRETLNCYNTVLRTSRVPTSSGTRTVGLRNIKPTTEIKVGNGSMKPFQRDLTSGDAEKIFNYLLTSHCQEVNYTS